MLQQNVYVLKIEKDFENLIPPLSSKEMNQLEKNIIRDGCREPLCIWNDTILDGHNRYEICTKLKIPFSIQSISLLNHEEAVAWICSNQLGRRNITLESRKYLIGKQYEMEKIIGTHNVYGINQHSKKEVRSKSLTEPRSKDTALRTREKLGWEYNISDGTVYRYGVYSHAIDLLSRVTPDLIPKILSSEVKLTHKNVVDMVKLPDQSIKRLCNMLSNNTQFNGQLKEHMLVKQQAVDKHAIPLSSGSIKNMPSYDPDAEISALSLTIPSWSSSISRAHSTVDLSNATFNACHKLQEELTNLKVKIEIMLIAIKEVV
jgi:hypothetical protein